VARALPARWVGEADRGLFFLPRLGEPPGLQEGVGHHRHQGMAVKSGPGSSFEVIEAQFFLELLMRLLANPARLDRAGESLDRGPAGQIGETVFACPIRAMLTHQPGLLTRHVLSPGRADPLRRTISNAHAHSRKAGYQPSLGSPAPTDLSPLRTFEHRVRGHGFGIRHVPHPWASASCDWEDQLHIGRIDLLVPGGMPTAQQRLRALSACRNGADSPYPASASTRHHENRASQVRVAEPRDCWPDCPIGPHRPHHRQSRQFRSCPHQRPKPPPSA
jgi:hypothetical protein